MPATENTATTAKPARSPLVRVGIVIGIWALGLAGFTLLLRVVWNAKEGWATIGLSIAAGALIYCLMAMYRMVQALGRPAVEFDLARTAASASRSERYLREERRRLLRAINELRFDHEMGKLSAADYKHVRAMYELQAVEVMRKLEGEAGLHPEVLEVLASLGLNAEGDAVSASEPQEAADDGDEAEAKAESALPAEPEVTDDGRAVQPAMPSEDDDGPGQGSAVVATVCAGCDGQNDPDARFCKFCGEALGE